MNLAKWLATLAGALISASVLAQTPQLVKLVVGYSAGGPVDAAARLFAPALAKEMGTQVIVENKPGASGALGGDAVAKSVPDGSTLFFAASPTMTITPHVQKKMAFDPVKDLTPVAPVLSYANVLVVNKELPIRTVADLVGQAKANPGKFTFGSAGAGASNHLSGELFAVHAGIKLTHVPYKGNAPAMTDVIGGQIDSMFDIVSTARSFIASGRVRALAVTSRERNRSLPDVPTMIEAGVPDFEVIGWYGVYGPAKMDPSLVNRLSDAIARVLRHEDLSARLVEQGYDLWTGTPQTLAEQQRKDFAMWAKVTKGIVVE